MHPDLAGAGDFADPVNHAFEAGFEVLPPGVCGHQQAVLRGHVVTTRLRLGACFEAFKNSMEPFVYGVTTRPLRAAARLWDLLWTLAEFPENTPENAGPHPALMRAHRWMQDHPAELLRLPQLAAHCGVSSNHLIRLFRKEHGIGPAEWHRLQRLRRAEQLLRHSNLSVKGVAAETGFTDLQQFNKLVRKHCGAPPRNLR
jgi:AraC-like DNA-binding protein